MRGSAKVARSWHKRKYLPYFGVMTQSEVVTVSAEGRVVLPAPLRHSLGFEPGVELLARADGDHLVLERREAAVARLRAHFANARKYPSVVGELLAERREEALREASG